MLHNPPRPLRFRRRERGVILIWVGVTLMVIAGFVVSTMGRQQALEDSASFESAAPAHARDVAEAGIVDALAWFRRQADQPVSTFAPKRDLGANPPVNETDDTATGIVRSYEVAPNLWARYEVAIGREREPFTDDNANGYFEAGETWADLNGNGRRDGDSGVLDITTQRGASGSGIVWRLESRGAIYRRVDNLPLGQGRNLRIAEARLATEIRRMAIRTPASAAICAARGDRVTIGPRARIGGSPGAAIAYGSGTGSVTLLSGAQLTGSPGQVATPDMDVSLASVFDTDLGGLRAAADLATTDPDSVPAPLPSRSLVVIEGNVTFTDARPLRGTAIVVVTGNCTIASGSNSFFGGILWVGGNLVVRAPALITGTILVSGTTDVRGLGGDFVEIQQDDDVARSLFQTLGQYRFTKAIHPAAGEDAPRPSTGGA